MLQVVENKDKAHNSWSTDLDPLALWSTRPCPCHSWWIFVFIKKEVDALYWHLLHPGSRTLDLSHHRPAGRVPDPSHQAEALALLLRVLGEKRSVIVCQWWTVWSKWNRNSPSWNRLLSSWRQETENNVFRTQQVKQATKQYFILLKKRATGSTFILTENIPQTFTTFIIRIKLHLTVTCQIKHVLMVFGLIELWRSRTWGHNGVRVDSFPSWFSSRTEALSFSSPPLSPPLSPLLSPPLSSSKACCESSTESSPESCCESSSESYPETSSESASESSESSPEALWAVSYTFRGTSCLHFGLTFSCFYYCN